MAVRPSMTSLVSRLRSITGAAVDDEFHGVTYWTDEQLEAELDRQNNFIPDVPLVLYRRLSNYAEYVFEIPRGCWLELEFTVRKSSGAEVGEPFTVRLSDQVGYVVFDGTLPSGDIVIDLHAVDWNAAAAAVWEQKAAHRFDYITIKAADYRFDAEQEYNHCASRAKYHAARRVKTFKQPKRGFTPAGRRRLR